MNIINPYQLFGVTENSQLEEVRKAYYSIALLCHPDKGGIPEHMKVLTVAYKWICDQISSEQEHRKTFEEYFGTEIKTANIPNFTDIIAESMGYTKSFFESMCHEVSITDPKIIERLYIPNYNLLMAFYCNPNGTDPIVLGLEELSQQTRSFLQRYLNAKDYLVQTEVYVPMSIPHGYQQVNDENIKMDHSMYSKTMTIYKEPHVPPRKMEASLEKVEQLEDYSVDTPIAMNDYQEAFMSYTDDLQKLEATISTIPLDKAYETYCTERDLQKWTL